MINEDAFELIVSNMKETATNNKKVFARYVLDLLPQGSFEHLLLDIWSHTDGDNQERLSIAFPQIASAILEYKALPEKKREKYLNKLLRGENETNI